MEARAARLGIGVPIVPCLPEETRDTFAFGLPVLDIGTASMTARASRRRRRAAW